MANLHIKSAIRVILPTWALSAYHYSLAILANIIYGFPSSRLVIIGVTGTQGKSTTAHMICHTLNELGQKCGLISTALIRIGEREWLNDLKMTMPGRFKLQSYLKKMLAAGCKFAVIETSSEGIVQWRHIGINYDAAVFTNLSPEHIESHGSYENYRAAKLKLWQRIKNLPTKRNLLKRAEVVSKISVVNADDKEADSFLSIPISKKIAFSINGVENSAASVNIVAQNIITSPISASFDINKVNFSLAVGGLFNVSNALAAIALISVWNFNLKNISTAIKSFTGTPGRLEHIKVGQKFSAIVDYAHTPESLEAVYKTLSENNKGKLISVLGSCGGGRDKAKRPLLGQLAAKYTDEVIVTNEDPYDEDPLSIMNAVADGARNAGKEINKNLFIVPDRRQAIARAVSDAKENDTVIITGKGCERWLMDTKGKIPWDDRTVTKEEIAKIPSA